MNDTDEAAPLIAYFDDTLDHEERMLCLEYLDAVYREAGGNGLRIVRSRIRHPCGRIEEVMDDRGLLIIPAPDSHEEAR